MIAASSILVFVAFVTLVLGVFRQGLGLIWTSIAASVIAAIFLALGVVQGNRRRVAPAGGHMPEPAGGWSDRGAGVGVMEREAEPETREAPPTLVPVPEPVAEESFRPVASAAREEARGDTVMIIPDRDKYHKESCRYAKNAAAMSMSKAAAQRQGYKACGVCKP